MACHPSMKSTWILPQVLTRSGFKLQAEVEVSVWGAKSVGDSGRLDRGRRDALHFKLHNSFKFVVVIPKTDVVFSTHRISRLSSFMVDRLILSPPVAYGSISPERTGQDGINGSKVSSFLS